MKLRVVLAFLAASVAESSAQRPYITIVDPPNGHVSISGEITLSANAGDADGYVAQVDYYIDGVLSASATEPPFVTGIDRPPGRYIVRAIAYDNVGYSAQSAPSYFQVGEELPVHLLRGPYLQSCSSTSMVVCWRTDWPTNSVVRFGTNMVGSLSTSNNVRTNEHSVLLTGLTPDTRYWYWVGSDAQTFQDHYPQTFRTAPTNARPVTVWAIGDFGTGREEQDAVRDGFIESPFASEADLWLMLGDNAYEEGTDDEYQTAVFYKYPMILPNAPVWPTIGNHDAALPDQFGRFAYLDIFNLPVNGEAGGVASGTERYYSFDYANIHFVCLDSQTSERSPSGAMLNWLREDLAATEKDWIVAYWHHPPYSSGTHFSDTELEMVQMREQVLPILESHGADLVLTGHSHVYERSYLINGHYGTTNTFQESMKLDGSLGRYDDLGPYRKPAGGLGADHGTVYVVCGCSGQGGSGNSFFYGEQPCMVRSMGGFGSMVLQFNGLVLDVKFLRPNGTFGDYFSIDKSQPTLARPELKSVRSGGGLELSWPTSIPTYSLETIFALAPNPWQRVTNPVARFGRRNRVNTPLAGTNQFFRLRAEP